MARELYNQETKDPLYDFCMEFAEIISAVERYYTVQSLQMWVSIEITKDGVYVVVNQRTGGGRYKITELDKDSIADSMAAASDYVHNLCDGINYASYIKSPEWQEKARTAKERAGMRCQLCNSKGELHAHHRTYENLGNERPEDIICLCKNCHAKFHGRVSA